MTGRQLSWIGALLLMAGFAWGCGEDPEDPRPDPRDGPYSPEHALNILQASYELRDIERYSRLLTPDFRFYFQPADIPPGLEREYWSRNEDSTGTGALFADTMDVSRISVDLGAFTVEDSIRVDQPDVKRIRLIRSKLEVELFNGVTMMVQGDVQEFYFRKGHAEEGTDPTLWYIFEWRDLPGGGGLAPTGRHPRRGADLAEAVPADALVQPATWGRLKALFR